jgi:hypothetical protein
MTKDRGPLGELADEIRKESPLPIFPIDADIPTETPIYWAGESVKGFLALAKKVNASMLYLTEGIVDDSEEDSELGSHVGETSLVEVAFLLDGQFHVFAKMAEWAEKQETPESGVDELTRAAKTLETRKDELVTEFLEDLKTHPLGIDPGRFAIEERFRRLVATKLRISPGTGFSTFALSHDGSPLNVLIQEIANGIVMDLHAKQVEVDRATVEPLVVECAVWAKKSGLTNLAMGDIQVFLDEKRVPLSREGLRLLWMKAKTALKTGKK